jgi:hypothetical protein
MTSSLGDEAEIKKMFTMILEKEIRVYREFNI